MKDFDELNKGKDIDEMECLFTDEEIEETIREMYPDMKMREVYYHALHIECNDSLKVAKTKEDLIEAIKEQVESDEL